MVIRITGMKKGNIYFIGKRKELEEEIRRKRTDIFPDAST
jgi:hypothetical protein